MQIAFGPFRLDVDAQTLMSGDKPVTLRRKTWDVLRYLSDRPGKLVTREELAEVVWAGVMVSDDVITAAVRELRRALGDGASAVIETIRGRGFRFVAELTGSEASPTTAEHHDDPPPVRLIGRADALEQLHDTWNASQRPRRRIVFVTGSAGIGKTALVDSFLAEVADGAARSVVVGRGECGEGILHPILQCLEDICRSPRRDDMLACLRRFAPEWLPRLSMRLKPADRPTASAHAATATDERLIGGLLDALVALAVDFPLVLALEDLHRCDPRTRTLLRRLTQRFDPVRLLVVGTYRTDAAEPQAGAMLDAWKDLVNRGKAREIALAPLDREGLESHLAQAYPGLDTGRFVDWAYRQTRGNPATLRDTLDGLAARGSIRRRDGSWLVADPLALGADYLASTTASPVGTTPGSYVGRVVERARLEAAWQAAKSGGRRTVMVSGEPGIGKSAIVRRFLDDLAATGKRIQVLMGKCTEQRSRAEAYMPVIDMFESWQRDDPTGEIAEQLLRLAPHWARQIPGVEVDAGEATALVAVDAQPERMLREAAALIETMAHARPLVLVLEDAHWADPATIDFLSYLATRNARAQLLLIVTYRPAEAAARAHLAGFDLASHDHIERIELRPLSHPEIRAWLESTFDHSTLVVDHLADEAARRSSGNPLFLQAVTRSLTAAGCVVETEEGWKIGASRLPSGDVPIELGGLIASQLRMLPDSLREILDVAAVAGEEFDAATIAAALQRPLARIDQELSAEARRSFVIVPAGSSLWPDGTAGGRYRFRHALYQSALFDLLSPHHRAQLHRSIAVAIETGYAVRLAPVTTELAEHYTAAGDHSSAATYLERSALLMIDRSALREAIGYFERAIEAIDFLPDDAERCTRAVRNHTGCGLSRALLDGPQSERVQHHIRKIGALLPRVDDLNVIFQSLRVLWFRDLFSWNLTGMAEAADELVRRSAESPDPAFRSLALSLRGITTGYRGEINAARHDLEESLRLCDDPRRLPSPVDWVIDARVETRCYLAWMLWLNGFPARSRTLLSEGLRLAEDGGHESTRCAALWFAASMSHLRREEIAYEYASLLDDYSGHVGFAIWRQFAVILRAVAELERGDESALDALLTALLGAGDQPSAMIARAYLLGQLAMAYGRRGDPHHGIALVEMALARIADNGLRVSESELLRIRGDLQGIAEDRPAAGASYDAALLIARQQGSVAFELRAAAARVRLHLGTAEEVATRAELKDIYDSFREGFDARDLVEVRALLAPNSGGENGMALPRDPAGA